MNTVIRFTAAALLASASIASADVKLPAVLGDGMVIQQNAEVRLWGWARPGEKVLISTSWSTVASDSVGDANGQWRAIVKTPAADGKPQSISFKGDNEVVIRDVLLGEVWVCSGQSNMEWPLSASGNGEEAVKSANHPTIRLFMVENTVSAEPQADCKGRWAAATPESAKSFSAVGYFFGRELHDSLKVPIGLISSDWGGTPAEAWTSEVTLRTMPDWEAGLAQIAKLKGDPAAMKKEYETAVAAWLKHFDESEPGSRAGSHWAAPDLDDADWKEAAQPGAWEGELANHDGTVWGRKSIEIPVAWEGKALRLELGPIDDNDSAYFNGKLVGQRMEDGNWNVPRKYTVPAELVKAGKAVIAVRMLDTGGPGGMMGKAAQLKIGPAGGGAVSLAGPWKLKAGAKLADLPRRPRAPGVTPWMPTSLYNGMIAPLTPMTIRGAIWYQGESNRERAFQYRTLFPEMIKDWRARWAMKTNAEFPFYFVQIAPFNYGGDKGEAAELREAQMLASALPNTGMAVTMDIGNPADIHPTKKKEVGHRLALWALAKTYGQAMECSGPTMKSITVAGPTISIAFDHAKGLNSGGKDLTHFTIAGEDKKFVPAKAVIEGETVVVSAEGVTSPVAVRYGWGAADEPNLKNGDGLPASSFRTDDWPGLTQKPPPKQSRLDVRDGVMVLAAPIDRWDEALPLGNGLVGGLLWGQGNTINLSLDRGDLWDLRTPERMKDRRWNYTSMRMIVGFRDQKTFHTLFDEPYDTVPYPTKLPGGRLEITLPPGMNATEFRLDLRRAEASVKLGGGELRAFVMPRQPVIVLKFKGEGPVDLKIVRPKGLDRLGYRNAAEGRSRDQVWMEQAAAGGMKYAVVAGLKRGEGETTIAVSITTSQNDSLQGARRSIDGWLTQRYEPLLRSNEQAWGEGWCDSSVHVPDAGIQAHYDLCRYLYWAASRPGSPPMPLQGVWTADEGALPPWKGDYHNDLNTQMTYLAYPTAGLFRSGESWLEFNWNLLPRYRQFARDFYGVEGAAIPGVMAIDGSPLGGWGMYSLSPTNGAWVAHAFYLHWKYTAHPADLETLAYPFCSEVATALSALLRPDSAGKLTLPLSSSPEIFDNSYRAWLKPNSNYDLALARWLFGACEEMATALQKTDEAAKWRDLVSKMDGYDVDDTGSLTFAKGEPFRESHRHFSHAMAIHPLGLMTIEGSAHEREVINATLDSIIAHGTSAWCGYSFSWFSCMLARCGRAEQALDYLERYQRGFILRNGFHCNGDQSGTGMSSFTYRPFTLEGNFLAMQAVHEMLLQSWGGTVRVFPAVSVRWEDVSFSRLRAEGGFVVSAARVGGRTTAIEVEATRDSELTLRYPFDGDAEWNMPVVRTKSEFDTIKVSLSAGQHLRGTPVTAPR